MPLRCSIRRRFRFPAAIGITCWLLLGATIAVAQTQVAVAPATSSTVEQELRLSGTLGAERSARLSPRVDGLVSEVLVDAGAQVSEGDVLLRLDATLAEAMRARAAADTAQANAARGEAQRRFEEAQRLVKDRHLPKTEVDAREAALAQANAAAVAAAAAEREQSELVRRHTLAAPFDGVITSRSTESGEWVARGDEVLGLVALDSIRLDVQAPQERFSELDADTRVEILPDTAPGKVLPARIVARVPVGGGSGSRTFLVRVVAQAADATLFPGTSATARFHIGDAATQSVQVPRDALMRHPDGGYSVFVVETGAQGSIAKRRQVRVGRESAEQVEVLEGVRAGESVVVRGNEVLGEDEPVRVIAPQG
jgi:RND family efflux transporter MFP subunit